METPPVLIKLSFYGSALHRSTFINTPKKLDHEEFARHASANHSWQEVSTSFQGSARLGLRKLEKRLTIRIASQPVGQELADFAPKWSYIPWLDTATWPCQVKKGENCDGTDFKMRVAATLPELSEWTLIFNRCRWTGNFQNPKIRFINKWSNNKAVITCYLWLRVWDHLLNQHRFWKNNSTRYQCIPV